MCVSAVDQSVEAYQANAFLKVGALFLSNLKWIPLSNSNSTSVSFQIPRPLSALAL